MKLVEITSKVEFLPKDWSEKIINSIIWGNNEFYKPKSK